jgi:iron complex outermembrane receptor protein
VTGSYAGYEVSYRYYRPDESTPGSKTLSADGTDKTSRYNLLAGLTYRGYAGKQHSFDMFAGYVLRSVTNQVDNFSNYNNGGITQHSRYNQYMFDNCFLATIDYGFRNKYFAGIVINQEHNTNGFGFISDHAPAWGQWVFYPGITASWNIGREKFMKNIGWISALILKGSYGKAGTRPYPSRMPGANLLSENDSLQTEITDEFTGALEAGFLKNRILARIEYYYQHTGNAMIAVALNLPPNLNQYTLVNGMKISNSGIEFKLMADIIKRKEFAWNSVLGFSMNKNKVKYMELIKSMYSGVVDYYSAWTDHPFAITTTTGYSLLAFNLPVFVDYYDHQPLYENENGGYTLHLDEAKREITDKVYPAYIFSWYNTFNVLKSFDVSVLFRYVAGHRIFNGTRMYLSVPSNYLYVNTLPEAESNYENGISNVPFGDLYLENASYLRLENLSVGYTFVPGNKKWAEGLKIYFAFGNLFTITGYTGSDPSFNYDSPGLDYFNTYPTNRTYTLGISLGI